MSSRSFTEDGFSYRLDLVRVTASARVDVTHSRPGEALVDYGFSGTVRLHNLTPNRVAPGFGLGADVTPYWNEGAPACRGDRDELLTPAAFPVEGEGVPEGACTVVTDPVWTRQGGWTIGEDDIPEGGFAVLRGDRGSDPQDGTLIFPEDQADAAAESLRHPDGWLLERDS